MSVLLFAAGKTVAPYAAVLLVGFLIGVYGHVIHSRMMVITGILIVMGLSTYFALRVELG